MRYPIGGTTVKVNRFRTPPLAVHLRSQAPGLLVAPAKKSMGTLLRWR